MKRLFVLFAISGVCLALWLAPAAAEESSLGTGFYQKNGVRDVFGDALVLTAAPEIEHFPRPLPLPEEKEDASSTAAKSSLAKAMPKEETAYSGADSDPVKEKLLSTYGDPAKDAPLVAVESAPAPFKGLMAALEARRDDVAFQYARQYVRHLRNLQQRSNKVLGLTGLAMEREGMLEGNAWHSAPQFQADRRLLEEDLEQSLAKYNEGGLELDAEARALVGKALQAEKEADTEEFTLAKAGLNPDALENSGTLNAALGATVPVDPAGQVAVFFFFRPRDMQALSMARDISRLYELSQSKQGFDFSAMTVDAITPAEESVFKRRTGAGFPFSNGEKLVRAMELDVFPATVFVAKTTGEAHIEAGAKSFARLEQVLRTMQGRQRR